MASLRDTLRFLIEDFHVTVLPSVRQFLVRRDLSLGTPLEPRVGNLVKVVAGIRRCGKSFRVYQEILRLIDEGVDRSRICYLNFDDDRLRPYPPDLVSQALEVFFELHPDARREGAYLFFDEIQEVPGWDVVARRIVDTEKVTMYCTGSSSKSFAEDIATEFRGRSVVYEMLPYSFAEFLRGEGVEVAPGAEAGAGGTAALDNKEFASRAHAAFSTYLARGGFPGVQGLDAPERVQTLQGYARLTVARDVVERNGYPNSAFVQGLARSVVASTARDFSIARAHNQGQSSGYSPGREAIGRMLDAFEDAHLAYGVFQFSRSIQRVRLGGFKVYAVDMGLFNAMSPATTDGLTRALETAVYLELRRRRLAGRAGEISLLKLTSGREVDFVWGDELFGQAYSLVQVCLNMDDEKTRAREFAALDEALARFPDARALVITLDELGSQRVEHGEVRILPAWRWMLGGE